MQFYIKCDNGEWMLVSHNSYLMNKERCINSFELLDYLRYINPSVEEIKEIGKQAQIERLERDLAKLKE